VWLVNWLVDRWYRVLEFFDTLYYDIRDAALYAWSWAVDRANDAYNRARSWAINWIDTVRANLANGIQAARQYASDLYASALSSIQYWYNRAVAGAAALVQGVTDLANALYNNGLQFALYWFNRAVEGAQALVQGVVDLVGALEVRVLIWIAEGVARATDAAQALIQGPIGLVGAVLQRVEKSVDDLRKQIGADDPATQGTLLNFLSNPFAFLGAILSSFLLDMLFDLLGHGLGTVKYNLPPPMTWGPGGSGGPFPIGPGPGPGASGLSAPLAHLSISGYTFRPGHPGLDLGLAMGEPVYAMHGGQVLQAGWNPVGYGFDVVLQGGDWWTRYAHLQAPAVAIGDGVKQAQVIGLGDTTGNSTGPHLHLEIKYRGVFIDPVTVLPL
jgi:murein DD-endopeptidase MepM/ murein hydrolase activator NlpD